jgi:DNA-binding MarR family transcriptional regulator
MEPTKNAKMDQTKNAKKDAPKDAAKARPTLPPADNLSSIAVSAQAIANVVDNLLRAQGSKLGLADWALLQQLAAQTGARPMAKIAVQLGVTRQRIQKQVDQLAASRLVDVEVAEDDKRSRTITLTKQGRDALAATGTSWSANIKGDLVDKARNLDGVRHKLERVSTLLGKMARVNLKAARDINGKGKGKGAAGRADD